MGKITYTEQQVGQASSAADLNSAFSGLATESASVDGANFREEGLGLESLASQPHVSQLAHNESTARQAITATTSAVLVMGATTFDTHPGGGGFTLNANEYLRVDVAFELSADATGSTVAAANGLSPDGAQFRYSIAYHYNNGVEFERASSVRHVGPLQLDSSPIYAATGIHAVCNTFAELDDAIVGGTGPVRVKVLVQMVGAVPNAQANIENAQLLVRKFARCA